jgi:UDP-N-acetylmuramate--alanine ligase
MLNVDLEKINSNIITHRTAKRRFNEQIIKNYVLIDDYAHHPTEVKAVISAVKQKYEGYKVIAFFQGHTFSRVKTFYKEFAEIFKQIDDVVLIKLAAAREKQEDYPNVSMTLIKDLLNNSCLEENYDYSKLISTEKTVILFMSPSSMEKYITKVKEVIGE